MAEGSSLLTTILKITFFIIFLFLFLYVLVITILSPILWQKYNEAIVDATLNSGAITVEWTIVHPVSMGPDYVGDPIVTVESNVSFTQTGPLAATLKSGNFSVHWLGIYLGYMVTPSNYFEGNQQPLQIHQFTNFTIKNITAYNQQAAIVANGGTIYWRFSGDVELSFKQYGITFDFTVYMIKDIQIVGKKPIGMKSFGIQPVKGFSNMLVSVSNQTFINPSNIGAQNLGNVTMLVYDGDDNFIGNAYIPNLDLKIGENFQENIISTAILTEESRPAIERMFSNWGMGIDQQFRAFGPVNASSGFYPLYNTSNQHFTVVGNKIPLIQNASIGPLITATQTIVNPTDMTVVNTDMVFTVTIPGLSNGFYAAFDIPIYNQSCPSQSAGLLLQYFSSANGTTTGYDVPLVLQPNSNQTIQFSVGANIPCANYNPIAYCCGMALGVFSGIPNDTLIFDANAEGSVTITLEDFTFRQHYQQIVPTTCVGLGVGEGLCGLVANICQVPGPGLTCAEVGSVYANPRPTN